MARKKQDQSNQGSYRAERKANQHQPATSSNASNDDQKTNDANKDHKPSQKCRDPNAYLQPGDSHFVDFHKQLSALGLMLRDVPGDGNCLFRALGDQMEGCGGNHMHHRVQVVKFMIENHKDFAPFVDDETTFEEYLETLRRPGTYAGQDVLVAFARMHKVNIVIHQLNFPLWQIEGGEPGCRQLHLSYHNGEHYSSVRKLGDSCNVPADITLSSLPCTSLGHVSNPQIFTNQSSIGTKMQNTRKCSTAPNSISKNQNSPPLAFLDSATEDEIVDSGAEFSSSGNVEQNGKESCEPTLDAIVQQVMDATNCHDPVLIMDVLMSHDMNVNFATDDLCNLLIMKDPPTPPGNKTPPPRRDSPTFYRLSGAKPKVPKNEKEHVSNRQRKEQKRRDRLQRQEEKKRGENSDNHLSESNEFNMQNAFQCLHL